MSKDERRINKRLDTKFEISYVMKMIISYLLQKIFGRRMFVYTERPPAVGSTIKIYFFHRQFKKNRN